MALPYFFATDLSGNTLILDEITSRHVISVLRMKKGDNMLLTNGMGKKVTAQIEDDNRKKCSVEVVSVQTEAQNKCSHMIGISLLKNAARFEWFLEKATELGITEIIPLLCERTESEKFRYDRMKGIITSALVQSQQCWMPRLHNPTSFAHVLQLPVERKFIAHCMQGDKVTLGKNNRMEFSSQLILIGPEGDFTPTEIKAALSNNFKALEMGKNRLRTETAGVVAAVLSGLP